MANTTITIDSAGRVVIPKPVRDALDLTAGDTLELTATGEAVTLRPVRKTSPLVKEMGVWVYRPETPQDYSLLDLIDEVREERLRDFLP